MADDGGNSQLADCTEILKLA